MIIKDKFKDLEYYGGEAISGNPHNDPSFEMWLRSGFPKIDGNSLWANCGGGAWLFYPEIDALERSYEFSVIHDLYEDYKCFENNLELADLKNCINNLTALEDFKPQHKFKQIFYRVSKQASFAKDQVVRLSHLLADDGLLYIFGPNREGMKPLQKWCAKYFNDVSVEAMSCGSRALSCNKPNLDDNFDNLNQTIKFVNKHTQNELSIDLHPAVFGAKKLDEGSLLLLENLPDLKSKKVLDLGCGAGVLSLVASDMGAELSYVDHSLAAVNLTKKNLANNGFIGEGYCTYIADELSDLKAFDVIITNPPFHKGARTDMDLGREWLKSCSKILKDDGIIYAVTNSFLRYPSFAQEFFNSCLKVKETPSFIVYQISNLS